MKIATLFFDFDGVLADSVSVKTVAFGKLFESFGDDVSEKVVQHHLENGGMSRFDKFRHYYSEFLGQELTEEKMEALCERFSALVVDEVVAAAEIPGAIPFLSDWSQKAPCYVVSATPQDEIRLIVERRGLSGYFQEIYGAPRSKTEHVSAVLNQQGLASEQCVFFGDALSDLKAAEANGVPFVGIVPNEEAPLLRARPDVAWCRDFTMIETVLEQVMTGRA